MECEAGDMCGHRGEAGVVPIERTAHHSVGNIGSGVTALGDAGSNIEVAMTNGVVRYETGSLCDMEWRDDSVTECY